MITYTFSSNQTCLLFMLACPFQFWLYPLPYLIKIFSLKHDLDIAYTGLTLYHQRLFSKRNKRSSRRWGCMKPMRKCFQDDDFNLLHNHYMMHEFLPAKMKPPAELNLRWTPFYHITALFLSYCKCSWYISHNEWLHLWNWACGRGYSTVILV